MKKMRKAKQQLIRKKTQNTATKRSLIDEEELARFLKGGWRQNK